MGQIDRQRDVGTDRQREGQWDIDRQRDGGTYRQTEGRRDRKTDRGMVGQIYR